MKSLTVLWSTLADEFARECCTSATMDIKTVQGRTEHEGLSFLTITLPSFGKDFQKSLDQGIVDRNSFQGFSWRAGLPRFLGGFLDLVFSRSSGTLLNNPSIEAIKAIRQLTLLYSKILLPCTPTREQEAMDAYVECEQEVRGALDCLDSSDLSEFKRLSGLLFSSVFSKLDELVYSEKIVPRHGPGSTADKLIGNEKFKNRTWTSRLQESFSFENFLYPNPRFSDPDEVDFLEPGDEIPVKVISVPKTMKTPRIIAVEPTHMQYVQQAILQSLIPLLEGSFLKEFLGFRHQEPNQLMAKEGSENGLTATLDLSEASDRVSNQLVRYMLEPHPHLLKGVDSCRSRRARVPGHPLLRLSKFASMGSALCFPFEAMVFLTIIFLGIQKELNVRFGSRNEINRFCGRVRVYGDDLIVPIDCAASIIDSLESFGARVGSNKSFWIGKFRESCGKEYYDGHDVSIVKVRRIPPTRLTDVPGVVSYVESRNQFYLAGRWSACRQMDLSIRKVLKYFPVVESTSPGLGRTSFFSYVAERECPNLHRPLVKAYVLRPVLPKNVLDGQDALLKCFLSAGVGLHDERHLERSGRPRAVDIKPRWTPPY
jgi:hypothetical protein